MSVEIHGYAIVSDDDKIAAADGLLPVSMRNEKDWDYYQRAQAASDLVVFARASHELEPNTRGNRRLVVSRSAASGFEKRADAWWWDPARVAWEDVVARLLPLGGIVATGGGQTAFDLYLRIGYSAFHLSHAAGVKLPGGRGVFAACDHGRSAADVLGDAGMRVSQTIAMDPEHGVEMKVWRRGT